MSVLEVKDIRKAFGRTQVLKGISFSLEKGQVLAIIGSSGSGKTTLLRCLNFLETADSGEIRVDGQLLTGENLTEEQIRFAESGMRMFAAKGMVFPFFAEFEEKAELPPCMADKLYVEYHTDPKSRVVISYLYDNQEEAQFAKEEMRHVGYGVFVKEFILEVEAFLCDNV